MMGWPGLKARGTKAIIEKKKKPHIALYDWKE